MLGRQGLAPSLTVNAGEQMPCEAPFGDGVREVEPHMLIEKSNGRGMDLIGKSTHVTRMVIRCGPRRVEAAAEVCDGTGRFCVRPIFGRQRLRHRGPGVEGRYIGTDGRPGRVAAE